MVDRATPGAPRVVWTVSALVHAVSDALSARFAAVTVRGELTSFSRAGSGHCYFSLKDTDGDTAMVRCAMFRRAAMLMDFSPADGQLVEVRGRLGVYEPRGELQFIVEAMRRSGTGALYEQFLRLKARLEAEGLFDAARKRPLPRYPRRVGVITSLAGAVLHDVLVSFSRRAPHVSLVVYQSPVQGSDAPDGIVRALRIAARRNEVDLLILCRGGGSIEDLWSFNDERVVRAIVGSAIPVLCGVGHETDITLADFAADLRAPTPTAAAELATPATADCMEVLRGLAVVMQRRVRRVLEMHEQRLDVAASRLVRPSLAVRRQGHALDLLSQRFGAAVRHAVAIRDSRLQRQHERLHRAAAVSVSTRRRQLESLEARLRALDPRRVLERGYAWLTDDAGTPVQSITQMSTGQELHASLADGTADLRVLKVHDG